MKKKKQLPPGRYTASVENVSVRKGYVFMEMSLSDGQKVKGWVGKVRKPSRRRR